ncbi:MAG: sensor histidine kinase [Clostridium sp.]
MFRKRLFKTYIIIMAIPLIFMFISYYNTLNYTNSERNITLENNLKIVSKFVDSTMTVFSSMTNYISFNDEIQGILSSEYSSKSFDKFNDTQKLYKITNSILATQPLDVPIHIIDKDRNSRFSTTDYLVPIYEDGRGNFFDILDKVEGKSLSYIHRRVDGKESKDIVMAMGTQIRQKENGDILGYVITDIYDDYLNDLIKNFSIYPEDNIYILDKSGYIVTDLRNKNETGFKFDEDALVKILSSNEDSLYMKLNNSYSKLYFTTSPLTGFKVVQAVPLMSMYNKIIILILSFIGLLIIGVLLGVYCSYYLSRSISNPINQLSNLMTEVEKGNRNVVFPFIEENDEIAHLGNSFNQMVKEINKLIEEVYLKQYLLKEAEFKALKAQVNPHFLYNTLESINWMAKLKDYDNVSNMITCLGNFLRYSVTKKGDVVTISEEINQINNYLTIQKIRYGNKFKVNIDIEQNIYEKKILRLLLQPLVENSIVHGLEQKSGDGIIIIRGYVDEEKLIFEVLDNGVGLGNSKHKGEGIGLDNVNSRIKIHYGEDFGLYKETKDNMTCIKIILGSN